MIKDYEDFKKFILSLTTIDLNAYKEKQMKRRIAVSYTHLTLPTKRIV